MSVELLRRRTRQVVAARGVIRMRMTKYCVTSPRLAMRHAFVKPWRTSAG